MEEKKWNSKHIEELFEATLYVEGKKEMIQFFRDLLTIREIIDLAERWQIAKQVSQGLSYREISKNLGVSTTTVTRVAHWLKNGEGGFQLILKRMKDNPRPKEEDIGELEPKP